MNAGVEAFLRGQGVILDVRSPSEFAQGHIPGAVSLPLFSDEERTQVGTLYKQRGSEAAFDLGLSLVGPKMAHYVHEAKQRIAAGSVRVHCWRGGLRSQAVANLLATLGFSTQTLHGGYKAFRRWALKEVDKPRKWKVLGGLSGCGKTEVLRELRQLGQQVLDLEALACHRGSSYGNLPSQIQPTNEQFENAIAFQLFKMDASRPIWIEDESRLVGTCRIPDGVFEGIRNSPLLLMARPLEERLNLLEEVYAHLPPEQLLSATERLRKRLGNERADDVIRLGKEKKFREAAQLVLHYYDRTYEHTLKKRKTPTTPSEAKSLTHRQWAQNLLDQNNLAALTS